MAIWVIGEPCIGTTDRSCVEVCPVDCIHETDQMLVIDPAECIGCSVCEAECTVEAIKPDTALPPEWIPFVAINTAIQQGRDEVNALVESYLATR